MGVDRKCMNEMQLLLREPSKSFEILLDKFSNWLTFDAYHKSCQLEEISCYRYTCIGCALIFSRDVRILHTYDYTIYLVLIFFCNLPCFSLLII